MSPKNETKKTDGFTAEEKAAMKERAKELKTEERARKDRAAGENAVLEAIAKMEGSDHSMAKRLHEIITVSTPDLMPKTWYGQPAYTNKDGKVICFFQAASKFNTRYATFGFQHDANLDEGAMWPVAFAIEKLTATEEKKIIALVKKAAS